MLFRSYAAKSIGLFFAVFSLIAALGGLVQIDPIWVYGPYNPMASMPGAQPDWYLGWVEGAMRLLTHTLWLHPGHHAARADLEALTAYFDQREDEDKAA